MKELSLNILDIAENSLKASATFVEIFISETPETLKIKISDNGYGMKKEMCKNVTDPFCTTRTTRKVGLGIPFFKLQAEQTGGSFEIISKHIEEYPNDCGTVINALFYKKHIDFTPLGNITETVLTLIQGHPEIDFYFSHISDNFSVLLDTRELRKVLGPEIPLSEYEVLKFIKNYLNQQYINL